MTDRRTTSPGILVIGSGDTKSDELSFLRESIVGAGGRPLIMDVSVLGRPRFTPEYSSDEVAAAAGLSLREVAASGDENAAITKMAKGASVLARRLCDEGKADGVLILGGSLLTDLGLDVALALPVGVPKLLVSTVAFSHLIPPDRIASDLMMVLWCGGLYGVNAVSRSVLARAAGAVVGAARAIEERQATRPVVGVTSLGSSCLSYMVALKPELERRGYEVAIFHATGMGGRAFETFASEGRFAAVMDFCLQEIVNHDHGVVATSAGPDRLEHAGRRGIPQIVAPGAIDMVDLPAWAPLPDRLAGRPRHDHNRLIGSLTTSASDRERAARLIAEKLRRAEGKTALILPSGGIQAWDRPGQPLHDAEALRAFVEAMRGAALPPIELFEIPDHINSHAFAARALSVFDAWVRAGHIPAGEPADA